MKDKSIKTRKYKCETTTKPDRVECIDDCFNDEHIANNNSAGNEYIDNLDELMIAQSKAQIRSEYRRSLGKEFVRRLK